MKLPDGTSFRLALESAPTGVLICDQAGTIAFANRQIERIFGYASTELSGRSVNDILPLANRPGQTAPEDLWKLCEPGPTGAGRDLTGRRKDGSDVSVAVGVTMVDDDDRRLVVASVDDISDRLDLLRRIEETAREHTLFERRVAELAAGFVMVRPDQVDAAIVDALGQIAESLEVDRCSWWHVPAHSKDAVVTHTWTRPEYRGVPSGTSAAVQVPWILSRALKGEIVSFASVENVPNPEDRENMLRFGGKSGACVPFIVEGELKAILGCTAIRKPRTWPHEVIDRLRLVAAVFGQALMRKESEEHLRDAMAELKRLRDELAIENVQLRREVKGRGVHRGLVAESPATRLVIEQLELVAPTNATVLLLGETGAGKEVFAQAIHQLSEQRGRPMVTVNCAALPPTLIESELFGRERGAYTGALARQMGRFEMAHNSTIFLDEIGELPLDAQVKLLRVLQEKVIERLGGGQPVKVNVRIIAATNRDLAKAVEDRTFREDLYYRLNVFPITVPPLRERAADIPALSWAFIEEYSRAFNKPIDSISKESLAALMAHHWPGNVRELRNVIERAIIVAKGPRLIVHLPAPSAQAPRASTRLDVIEAEQIQRALESVGWRVRGPGGAAELLGLKPTTLDSRMVKLGIRRPSPPAK